MQNVNVDKFIRVARNNGFDLLDLRSNSNSDERYGNFNVALVQRDIQILNFPSAPGIEDHIVTILYQNAVNRAVYVYDSARNSFKDRIKSYGPQLRKIVNIRYGKNTRIIFVEPKTKQPDAFSRALLAIQYADLLMLRQDPKYVVFEFKPKKQGGDVTMRMRWHVYLMILNNKLSLFSGIRPNN